MRVKARAVAISAGLLTCAGAVFAALPPQSVAPTSLPAASPAVVAASAEPRAPIVEARWTTEPVRVTRQDLPRLAPVVREPPPVAVAAVDAAPAIPLPPPRPPELRERAPGEQDRAFLRDWCATADEAVHVCPLIGRQQARELGADRRERRHVRARDQRGVRVVTIAGPRRVQAARPSYENLVRNQLALMER
jgi:hypothetical protein